MKREQIAYEKGYIIDKQGNVYYNNRKRKLGYKEGYLCFTFRYNKKHYLLKVHRFQAYMKYGEDLYKNGIIVRHLNNIKTDNSWDNIAIGTNQDNYHDNDFCTNYDKVLKGAKKTNKYDKEFVELIRKENETLSYNQISKKYNLAKSTISYIINHDYITHKKENINKF